MDDNLAAAPAAAAGIALVVASPTAVDTGLGKQKFAVVVADTGSEQQKIVVVVAVVAVAVVVAALVPDRNSANYYT